MERYDVIVVGARVAGASAALQLARLGHSVLFVDKTKFPSDTLSTHILWPPAQKSFERLGLLERIRDCGAPSIPKLHYCFPGLTLSGFPPPFEGIDKIFAPRRTVLDKIIVDAAVDSGATLWENSQVQGVVKEGERVVGVRLTRDGGAPIEVRASVVIGADGMHSRVAKSVGTTEYNGVKSLSSWYYTYFSGLPSDLEFFPRQGKHAVLVPTNDGQCCLAAGWKTSTLPPDPEVAVDQLLEEIDPALASRVRAAHREERYRGTATLPNYYRVPQGPGWLLIGDAGYHRDPLTGHGIPNAVHHSELAASAVDDVLCGRSDEAERFAAFQAARDADVTPMYEYTVWRASLSPDSSGFVERLKAIADDQSAIDRLFGVLSGTVPVYDVFPQVPRLDAIAVDPRFAS